jgi:hypothetical protein
MARERDSTGKAVRRGGEEVEGRKSDRTGVEI